MTDCNKIQANNLACNKISLTEQWEKGELPEGYYYVKDGENMIAEYLDGYFYNNGEPMTSFTGGVDSIFAPVPSYEEWKNFIDANNSLFDAVKMLNIDNFRLEKQNAQLKELLKECRNILHEQTFHRNTILETDETLRNRIVKKAELLTKIDEALK